MTGCAPAELLAGGQEYFDALVEECNERAMNGYVEIEMLANITELLHANYRALLAMGGSKDIPRQLKVPRPPGPKAKQLNPIELRDAMRRLHGN